MNKKKKHNSNNKRRRNNYPSPVQRLDNILIAEVRMAIQLGLSDDTIMQNYKITFKQLDYCKRAKISFENLLKEDIKND